VRGWRIVISLAAGHVTLLHSVAELARIELLVADFEGIRAALHFRYGQAVGWGAGRILEGNGYGPFMDVVMGIGDSIENG
jgi:hypothetical protein